VPEATRRALADLPTSLRRVVVPPLEERWAAGLVRQIGGADLPDDAVSDVVGRTGGNPFFLAEVARLLARGAIAGPLSVPAGAREAVQRRVARLPQSCHAVLTAAAVAGESATGGQDDIEVELIAAVCGIDMSTVAQRLEEAGGAGLVVSEQAGRSRLRFHHALVREALVAAASIVDVERLHRRVAEVLTERAEQAVGDPAAAERLAHHWSRAGGPGAAEQTGRWSQRAADAALHALAFEQAADHLARAVTAPNADPVGLRIRLGEAQRLAGDLTAARTTLIAAARLAEERRRPEDLAAAALGLGGGIAGFEVPIADQEQVDLLRRAEAGLPGRDGVVRAAVLARLSVALTGLAGVRERQRLAEQAVAIADRGEDKRVAVAALAAWCDAAAGPDFVEARIAGAGRMLALAPDRVS
jgi:hypothetical protein